MTDSLLPDLPPASGQPLPPRLLAVTWGMTLQVWWSYFWRTTVYVLLIGAFLGFLTGLVYGMLGHEPPDAMVFNVIGTLLSVPISLLVLRDILEKPFRRFTIALVARSSDE